MAKGSFEEGMRFLLCPGPDCVVPVSLLLICKNVMHLANTGPLDWYRSNLFSLRCNTFSNAFFTAGAIKAALPSPESLVLD